MDDHEKIRNLEIRVEYLENMEEETEKLLAKIYLSIILLALAIFLLLFF